MVTKENDKTFKKPIVIIDSIYTDEQSFANLDEIESWALSNKVLHEQYSSILTGYFEVNELESFTIPFVSILDSIQAYNESKNKSARTLQALSNEFQDILEKTLSVGLTFASPSRVLTMLQTYGRTPHFIAGFFSEAFNLTWIMNIQSFRHVLNQGYFHQGTLAARYFENQRKNAITGKERSLSILFTKSEAELKGVVEDATEKLNVIDKTLKSTESSRKRLDNRISAFLKKRLKEHYKFRRRYNEDLKEAKQNHDEQIEAIRDAFSSEIALREPSQYWNTRANNSRNAAIGFGTVFVLVSSAFATLAYFLGPQLYASMTLAAGKQTLSLAAVAVFTFPVIVGLWILKSLARLFVENLHVHQDASYRHMIITTYLSMLQDPQTPITPEEREHALRAIFSNNPGKADPISLPTDRIFAR